MFKLRIHYILLFLAIAMILYGLIFSVYTKDESYIASIIVGLYLLSYSWLWLHTHYHWSHMGNKVPKEVKSKNIYSIEKVLINFIIFVIIFFIALILFVAFNKFFPWDLMNTYLFIMGALLVYFVAIPSIRFSLQDRYVANKKIITQGIVLISILVLISLYFDIKGWNNNFYYIIFLYCSYALLISFLRDFYYQSKK